MFFFFLYYSRLVVTLLRIVHAAHRKIRIFRTFVHCSKRFSKLPMVCHKNSIKKKPSEYKRRYISFIFTDFRVISATMGIIRPTQSCRGLPSSVRKRFFFSTFITIISVHNNYLIVPHIQYLFQIDTNNSGLLTYNLYEGRLAPGITSFTDNNRGEFRVSGQLFLRGGYYFFRASNYELFYLQSRQFT